MAHLAIASPDQIDAVYRESHALWGAGLSARDYRELWQDLSSTSWATKYARFYVWVDRPSRVLSSLKVYRPRVRVLDRTGRASVIGAVFTPRAHRRRGHASDLVRAVLDAARERGDHVALLFSDIGTDYYRRFGFHELPAEEQWGPLSVAAGSTPPELGLEPAGAADEAAIHEAHRASCRRRAIEVIRDAEHWQFLGARSRSYFERLRDGRVLYHVRVARQAGRFVGYLITVEGRREWNLREVGAVDGDARGMAAIVRAGAAAAHGAGLRRMYGWLPRELTARLGDWPLRNAPRHRAVPMILSLGRPLELDRLRSPERAYIPFQDQF